MTTSEDSGTPSAQTRTWRLGDQSLHYVYTMYRADGSTAVSSECHANLSLLIDKFWVHLPCDRPLYVDLYFSIFSVRETKQILESHPEKWLCQ